MYRILKCSLLRNSHFGRSIRRWKDNIRMDIRKISCWAVNWTDPAQDHIQRQAVLYFWVLLTDNYLYSNINTWDWFAGEQIWSISQHLNAHVTSQLTLLKLSSNLYAPPPVALTVVTRVAMPLDLASARKFPISLVGKRMKCSVPLRCLITMLSI